MTASLAAAVAVRLATVLDWIYPPRCRFCGKRLPLQALQCFCGECLHKIRLVAHPLCSLCGRPYLDISGEDHLCGPCIVRAPHFRLARAWACYPREELEGQPLRDVIQRFKYGRKVSLGKPLGELMAVGCALSFQGYSLDIVVPVPLHPKRLRWRGFNQALVLARVVGRRWRVPVDPFILARSRETPPQTQLSEEERRKNVRGAFSVNPRKTVKGKSALLVDDVYTSGATVNECSRVLRRAGARDVYVLTLARAVS